MWNYRRIFFIVIMMMYSIATSFARGEIERNTIPFRVGVSLPTQWQVQWVVVKKSLERYADISDVSLLIRYSDMDPVLQEEQVNNLLFQGISVLVLASVNAATAGILVDNAHNAGVQTISFRTLIQATKYLDYHVSFDFKNAGDRLGDYMSTRVPTGNYVFLSILDRNAESHDLYDGMLNSLEPIIERGDCTVFHYANSAFAFSDASTDVVVSEIDRILTQQHRIDVIIAPNDDMAGRAYDYLNDIAMRAVFIIGNGAEANALKRIRDGEQDVTFFEDYQKLSRVAIELSSQILEGATITTNTTSYNGKIQVPSLLVELTRVMKDTPKELFSENGQYDITHAE